MYSRAYAKRLEKANGQPQRADESCQESRKLVWSWPVRARSFFWGGRVLQFIVVTVARLSMC